MDLNSDYLEMLLRLLTAVGAGACIGYERSFHGRPAGLRTHVLVCLASAVLMLVTVYEDHWVRMSGEERLDPTRMAQRSPWREKTTRWLSGNHAETFPWNQNVGAASASPVFHR